jgi:hypothetical protein
MMWIGSVAMVCSQCSGYKLCLLWPPAFLQAVPFTWATSIYPLILLRYNLSFAPLRPPLPLPLLSMHSLLTFMTGSVLFQSAFLWFYLVNAFDSIFPPAGLSSFSDFQQYLVLCWRDIGTDILADVFAEGNHLKIFSSLSSSHPFTLCESV